MHIGNWWGSQKEINQDVRGWIILKWILERVQSGMDCIDLAQDRDKWRALENTVMNRRVP
jgi:hypothetical protein